MKLQLRDNRPPGDWIETSVKSSPFLDLCPAEEQRAYLSGSDEFKLLVANKRTLVASLEESLRYDDLDADENQRSCVKAWAAAVFERAGGAAAARTAAAAAGTDPDANLGQAVAPMVCFATLVYSIAEEVEERRKRIAGYLAGEVVAAAAATLATQGDAHQGPFWNPSEPEIVADYPVEAGAELSDVFCVAVLARCAMVLATRGGALVPWKRPRAHIGLLVSLLDVVMVPVKFVRAAATTAPPHFSLEARAIWQMGMEAAALFMVYGESVQCWPRLWDDSDDELSDEEEGECSEEGRVTPAVLAQLANFFAAYLGALGAFVSFDMREHPWGMELWKRAVLYALSAHEEDPLVNTPIRIKQIPGLEYFLQGAVPPGTHDSVDPCLPTDALSLRGLAYILIFRNNYRSFYHLDTIKEYVDRFECALQKAAACVLSVFYRTVCQVGMPDAIVESGLLDVLLDKTTVQPFAVAEDNLGDNEEEDNIVNLMMENAECTRQSCLAAILARCTAVEDGRELLAKRAPEVLESIMREAALRVRPENSSFKTAIENGYATRLLTATADIAGPACLALANLLADRAMAHLDEEPVFKSAIGVALELSKALVLDFNGVECTDAEKDLLVAIHRSTLGLAAAALEGGFIFSEYWGTRGSHVRAASVIEIIDESEFDARNISRILDIIISSCDPVENSWLHRQFEFSSERGIVAARPGAGFPYIPIPLFTSGAALMGLFVRMEHDERSFDDRDHHAAKEAVDLLLDVTYEVIHKKRGKPLYERYRKGAAVACLSWAIADQLPYFLRRNQQDAIDALAQAVDAMISLMATRGANQPPEHSEAVAWDANEEAGFGDDPESEQHACFNTVLYIWGQIFGIDFKKSIARVIANGQAGETELEALFEDVRTVDKQVEKLSLWAQSLEDHEMEALEISNIAANYIRLNFREPFNESLSAVRKALEDVREPIRAAVERANAAAAALLVEEEGLEEPHVADETRRLKRQRQKEKQRAAKEEERARREAEEAEKAARKAEKERLKAEAERKEAEKRAQQERVAAARASAKAAQEAVAAAAAKAKKERKLAEKREKKAKKRAEKLAAREAQAKAEAPLPEDQAGPSQPEQVAARIEQQTEGKGPRPGVAAAIAAAMAAQQQANTHGPRPAVAAAIAAAAAREAATRQPLGALPHLQQQQPPRPASSADDLNHLLGVLLPSAGADQENVGPNSAASARTLPKSPSKLLGPLARDPLRWASLVAALSCPISGTVFSEPVLLMDGQTYEEEAAGRLGATAAAGVRPNLTMRKLVRELRDMGCAV